MLKAIIDTILIMILLGSSSTMLVDAMRLKAKTQSVIQTAISTQAETTEIRLDSL